MADAITDQKRLYPLPVYNYRVTVYDPSDNGQAVSVGFSEVSGITLEHEIITYKHGLSFLEGEVFKKYYYDKYQPITLKRGVVKGDSYLFDWMMKKENNLRQIEIRLCDEKGVPVVTWKVRKAVPVKLSAPTFSADSNDVAIESMELMGAGITIKYG